LLQLCKLSQYGRRGGVIIYGVFITHATSLASASAS